MDKKDAATDKAPVRRRDDIVGANSDIGKKLRALYGAIEKEEIPSSMLDLLERLDRAEMSAAELMAQRKGSAR
jgi:hypothetical protein